jgi:hypothetical protein
MAILKALLPVLANLKMPGDNIKESKTVEAIESQENRK